ncbi:CPBP family intramembrane glutamic endopeptidase [Paenibacillus turpanensis]|uniref:CPBP family intramembrane glutamic endopeptidase n=1 Tax=Paenibacillus turpanensis TaxID=2689078 RepID=UPI00140A6D0C|nr:type II CAAX endopeptidase family protein [Paenibacillus turpanensis]
MKGDHPLILVLGFAALTVVQAFVPNPLVTLGVPVILALYGLYVYRKEWLAADWNEVKRPTVWAAVYRYFVPMIVLQAAVNAIMRYAVGLKPPEQVSELVQMLPALPVFAVLLSPLIEEIVFRKAIFGGIKSKLGFPAAAVISSLLFMTAHGNYAAFPGLFIAGFFLCLAYHKTGSITVPIIMHVVLNLLSIVGSSFV